VQVLGTVGYFSRGSAFADGAVQAWLAQHWMGTVSVLHSHSTSTTTLTDQYGLSLNRTDVSGGIDFLIRPTVTIYGTLGRTIGTLDSTDLTSFFTVGVTFQVSVARQRQP
jgi:hypothetical protein